MRHWKQFQFCKILENFVPLEYFSLNSNYCQESLIIPEIEIIPAISKKILKFSGSFPINLQIFPIIA